ncbi:MULTISPECIES: hypothetical protein [Morganellaceae]|uniref:hypothetical protein n=1 Tax=Morganellaceae TaxID=1903414 RepID=UPI00109C832C|nr:MULTISPECIES: hypothetical protein [unclassified Providencia]THB21808.1 hypothetical protein E6R27_19395 [Providencia sp. MGF014]TNU98253.1 hypothetical protein FH869_19240 [Providencia rettgeri]WOB88566.1 hypothetical protein P3L40_23415 [Providencia sp. PROV040]
MKLTEEQKADRRELVMLVQYAALAYALFGAGVAGLMGALDVNSLWMGVAIALVSHVLIFSRPSVRENFPEAIYWVSLVACAIGGPIVIGFGPFEPPFKNPLIMTALIVFIVTALHRRQAKKEVKQ